MKNRFWSIMNPWFREHIIIHTLRSRLKNHNVSILTNNCLGGCISHDLGLKFNSPFINLWLTPEDFVKYCKNIPHYISCRLFFLDKESDIYGYPVALLDDIKIYFQHYHSQKDALVKWEERSRRLNLNNVCCIMVERDNCTDEILKQFSLLQLPKVVLMRMKRKDIVGSVQIKGFEQEHELGNIMEFKKNCYFGHKYYDDFDFVKFLNSISCDD